HPFAHLIGLAAEKGDVNGLCALHVALAFDAMGFERISETISPAARQRSNASLVVCLRRGALEDFIGEGCIASPVAQPYLTNFDFQLRTEIPGIRRSQDG